MIKLDIISEVMYKILAEIYDVISEFLERHFWDFRGSLYDYDATMFQRKIRSNRNNLRKYHHACDELRKGADMCVFTLHDGEVVTLY